MGRDREEIKLSLTIRVPLPLLSQIEEFEQRHNCRDRSAAISRLLEFAFYMEKKVQEAEQWTPEDMDEIKKQFEEGALVDWIQKMDPKRLEIMADIFRVERDARQKQKKLPQY